MLSGAAQGTEARQPTEAPGPVRARHLDRVALLERIRHRDLAEPGVAKRKFYLPPHIFM